MFHIRWRMLAAQFSALRCGRGTYCWADGAEESGEYQNGMKQGWHVWRRGQEQWNLQYRNGKARDRERGEREWERERERARERERERERYIYIYADAGELVLVPRLAFQELEAVPPQELGTVPPHEGTIFALQK